MPTSYPLNCSGEETSSSSILVKWLPVPLEHRQGNLIGYAIKYDYVNFDGYDYRVGNLSGVFKCPGDWNLGECEIPGLALYTNFTVQVGGMTVAGIGVWSPPIVVATGIFCKCLLILVVLGYVLKDIPIV